MNRDDARAPISVARAYDRWSSQYDADANATRDLDALVLRGAGLDLASRRVLELGCGTGKNSVFLAGLAQTLLALDFSSGMLAVARARVPAENARFVQHDIRDAWPAEAGGFDVVVGNLVLEHVADLAPIFAEAARVLAADGQLFLCELHPYRQLAGAQARFIDARTQETVQVPAFMHTTSDYVNGGIRAGFALRELGEWVDPRAPAGTAPRLITLRFARC